LVVFGAAPLYQLYLTNNKIRVLPPSLFRFTKLNVLALRQNRLSELPSAVGRLERLTDLYLGTNRLRYLPAAVLRLRHLAVLLAGPNPFLAVAPDAVARYDVLYRETKRWKHATPHLLHPLITRAILCGQYRHTCSQCNLVVVEPYAEVFEWWDILDNKLVPIKRDFCSGRCLHQWRLADVVTGEAPDAAPELPEPPLAVLG
jgi:NAD-dependent dihydropyrimidine dehydrogenase PreA subunit